MTLRRSQRLSPIKLGNLRFAWEQVELGAIRGPHPAVPHELIAGYPGTMDDVLALTPSAIELMLHLKPLLLSARGRAKARHFNVVAGLETWRALRPWIAATQLAKDAVTRASQDNAASIPSPLDTQGEKNDEPPLGRSEDGASSAAPVAKTETVPSANKGTTSRRQRQSQATLEPFPVRHVPALVSTGPLADAVVAHLAMGERWLLSVEAAPAGRVLIPETN